MPKRRRRGRPPAAELEHIAEPLRPLAEPLDAVQPDPKNARVHSPGNLEAIRASLKAYGQRQPVVANSPSGIIEAGNGRWLAAQQLGWEYIAVVWVKDAPGTQTGFSIADNRTAELAEWSQERLGELFEDDPFDGEAGLREALQLDGLFGPPRDGVRTGDGVDVVPIDPNPPPRAWVLVGIPTVRFHEIAETVERLAALEDVIVETALTNEAKEK